MARLLLLAWLGSYICLGALGLTAVSRQMINTSNTFSNVAGKSIMIYFVNMDGSLDRATCMKTQLSMISKQAKQHGLKIDFTRFPAVAFDKCHDVVSCTREKPKCFPNKHSQYMFHGTLAEKDRSGIARAVRGILGNWCAHLNLLRQLGTGAHAGYDYYMVLEDDCIFKTSFTAALINFLSTYPDKWSLVQWDTFTNEQSGNPKSDQFDNIGTGTLSSMSPTRNTYWGAHAWLLNKNTLGRFTKLYTQGPTLAVDMISKVQAPPDVAMWAYQTGSVAQEKSIQGDGMAPKVCKAVSGSDINGDGQSKKVSKNIETGVSEDVVLGGPPAKIVVLGMPHSGVSAMTKLISKHYTGIPVHWTSAHPTRLSQIDMPMGPTTLGVVMIRHPFAIMQRFRFLKKTKDGMRCDTGEGVGWVAAGCSYRPWSKKARALTPGALPDPALAHCPKPMSGNTCWKSIPGAWSSFLGGYKKVEGKFMRIVYIRYEDMFANPSATLMKIAKDSGLTPKPNAVSTPLKLEVGLDATPNVDSLDFGAHFTCEMMKAICSRLEKTLLWKNGYRGCQTTWLGYQELIYHGHRGKITGRSNDTSFKDALMCNAAK